MALTLLLVKAMLEELHCRQGNGFTVGFVRKFTSSRNCRLQRERVHRHAIGLNKPLSFWAARLNVVAAVVVIVGRPRPSPFRHDVKPRDRDADKRPCFIETAKKGKWISEDRGDKH